MVLDQLQCSSDRFSVNKPHFDIQRFRVMLGKVYLRKNPRGKKKKVVILVIIDGLGNQG